MDCANESPVQTRGGLTLEDCKGIYECGRTAVSIGRNVDAKFVHCNVYDNKNFGVELDGNGSKATIEDSEIRGSGTLGVYASEGATLTAIGCKIEKSAHLNCEIKEQGTVILENCEVTGGGKGIGIQAHHGGTIQLVASKVYGDAKFGVMVGDGGVLKGLKSQIAQCGTAGVYTQAAATVEMMSCIIEKNGTCTFRNRGSAWCGIP
jgi:hypothetical protein